MLQDTVNAATFKKIVNTPIKKKLEFTGTNQVDQITKVNLTVTQLCTFKSSSRDMQPSQVNLAFGN